MRTNIIHHAVEMIKFKLTEDRKFIHFELKNSSELEKTSRGEHLEGTIDMKKPEVPIKLRNLGQAQSEISWKMTNFKTYSVGFD